MENIIANLSASTHFLIHSITTTVLDTFTGTNSPYIITLLLPIFFFVGFVGIARKDISAVLLIALHIPACTNGLLRIFEQWRGAYNTGVSAGILDAYIAAMHYMRRAMPLTMVAVIAAGYLISTFVASASWFFYVFVLAFYYNSVLSALAKEAYFSPEAFFCILATLPIIVLSICSRRVNAFVAATVYGFTASWGLLSIVVHRTSLIGPKVADGILRDILNLPFTSIEGSTVFFFMAVVFSIFVQYSLESSIKSTAPRDCKKKQNGPFVHCHIKAPRC